MNETISQIEQWTNVFDILKTDLEVTLETITSMQLVQSFLQNDDYVSLYELNAVPILGVYKNNVKIIGGLDIPDTRPFETIAETVENSQCNLQYPKYYNYIDITPMTRIFAVKWNDLLILGSVELNRAKKRLEESQKRLTRFKWITFITSFIVWILMVLAINQFKFQFSKFDIVFYLLIAVIISYLNTANVRVPISYDREILEKSELNGKSLAIASISIGLSFLFQFADFPDRNLYLRYLLFSFVFSLLSLMIPNYAKTGFSVRLAIIIQRSIINFSISFLFLAIYVYFKDYFQGNYKKIEPKS